jgi:hypothetical protein
MELSDMFNGIREFGNYVIGAQGSSNPMSGANEKVGGVFSAFKELDVMGVAKTGSESFFKNFKVLVGLAAIGYIAYRVYQEMGSEDDSASNEGLSKQSSVASSLSEQGGSAASNRSNSLKSFSSTDSLGLHNLDRLEKGQNGGGLGLSAAALKDLQDDVNSHEGDGNQHPYRVLQRQETEEFSVDSNSKGVQKIPSQVSLSSTDISGDHSDVAYFHSDDLNNGERRERRQSFKDSKLGSLGTYFDEETPLLSGSEVDEEDSDFDGELDSIGDRSTGGVDLSERGSGEFFFKGAEERQEVGSLLNPDKNVPLSHKFSSQSTFDRTAPGSGFNAVTSGVFTKEDGDADDESDPIVDRRNVPERGSSGLNVSISGISTEDVEGEREDGQNVSLVGSPLGRSLSDTSPIRLHSQDLKEGDQHLEDAQALIAGNVIADSKGVGGDSKEQKIERQEASVSRIVPEEEFDSTAGSKDSSVAGSEKKAKHFRSLRKAVSSMNRSFRGGFSGNPPSEDK